MAWSVGNTENVLVQTEMVGAREFQAEANANAASVERMGAAARTASIEMSGATKRSWLMSQSMFTLRRVAYAGTLALAAIGTGAVYMGLKFDSTMQQNTVTMSHFLDGVKGAKQELQTLFQLAATTPFDFAGVTTAAKQFLAFGFGVQETNKDLRVIADTASAFGGSTDVINRIVLALGQMRAKGKVMGQELLQLQEVGVPALQILQEQLHLTDQQVANIGTTGIKASVAIPALIKGLQDRYGGLSAQQAKTFQGQLSTLKDYAAQTLGALMMPLFQTMQRDVLPTAILIATAIQKGFGAGGLLGSLRAIQASNAPTWFKLLYADIYQLVTFINGPLRSGLAPIATDLLYVAGAILYILGPLLQFTNYLDRHTHIVSILITAYAAFKIVSLAIGLAQNIILPALLATINGMYGLTASTEASTAATFTDIDATAVLTAMYEAQVLAMTELNAEQMANSAEMANATFLSEMLTLSYSEQLIAVEALTGATAEMDVAMAAGSGPIGWIIIAVVALAVGFYLLYTRVKWFHDFINHHWRTLLVLLTGPIGLAIVILVNHFEQFKGYITGLFNWIAKKAEWLANKIEGIPGFGYLKDAYNLASSAASGIEGGLAHLADGGTVMQGGLSWVGERGPELMWLPPSAQVAPLDHVGSILGGDGGAFTSHTTLVLDRKVVGEASSKYTLDREARK